MSEAVQSHGQINRPRVPVRYIRLGILAMTGFLAYPVVELLNGGHTAAATAAGLAGLATFGGLFTRAAWASVAGGGRAGYALPGMALVAVALFTVLGATWLLTASYYFATSLQFGPRRWMLPGLAGVLVADIVIGVWVLGAEAGWTVAVLAQITVFGVLIAGFHRMSELWVELRAARARATQAAVAEERLRIARDLHDVLGQRLTEVVLKSELAARLVGRDPDRAVSEMIEMARVARDALGEVRTTVSGYRRVTLAGEIATARTLLRSAAIEVETAVPEDPLPEPVAEAAAWVVREGVTNVLRHAMARRCEIRVAGEAGVDESVVVTVSDDGPAVLGISSAPPRFGGGLSGLSERITAIGGRICVVVEDGHLMLRAEIPRAPGREG